MTTPGTLTQTPDETVEVPRRTAGSGGSGVLRKVADPFVMAGEMWQLMVKVFVLAVRKPVGFWADTRDQCFDILKLTWLPMSLAAFGFGFGAPGLTGGAIFYTFGIPYRLGAFFEFASVREFAPFINGMVVAGVVGTAITADLGARRIRDEIDAMEVLGVDPLYRLVVPRVAATIFVSVMIIGIVIAAGIGGGYFFNVIVSGGSAGSFLASFTTLATLTDLVIAIVKAAIFGWMAGICGAYKGLGAGGGPSGVGRAVNETVIVTFMLLFFINALITAVYFQLIPQQGM
jgi:phospholipid/cholesterol/gamma-HCH transport system permease protein